MKKDDIILCPFHAITYIPKPIQGETLSYELIEKDGQHYLKHRVSEIEEDSSYEDMLMRFRLICTGLSIATVGQFWVEDVLLNHEFQQIWKQEKVLYLVVDKEIDPSGPRTLDDQSLVWGHNITYWISQTYPRVFMHYYIGLVLLRSSLPVEYLHADALLNFFKIVELVVYKRTGKKPNLDVIRRENKYLNIIMLDDQEIKEFYKIRSRDSAHDWDKVQPVSRKQVVECKMWADELII